VGGPTLGDGWNVPSRVVSNVVAETFAEGKPANFV
jgi:hypothetical protein